MRCSSLRPSRAALSPLVVSAVLAGLAWTYTRVLRPVAPPLPAAAVEVATDSSALPLLRQQWEARQKSAWDDQRRRAFQARFPSAQWRDEPPVAGQRAFTVTLTSPPERAWTECLSFAAAIDAEPGVAIRELHLAAAGPAGERRFTHLMFHLAVPWRTETANSSPTAPTVSQSSP